MRSRGTFLSIATLFVALAAAQQAAQTGTGTVPQLIPYSGIAKDVSGKPLSGVVGITFLLYQQEQGGSPLWLETQGVQADSRGHYSVQLGATLTNGVPNDLFVSGEARWLGIQIAGQSEAARVMLLSVPYAMKAGDAQTLGGLPPSAFMLSAPASTGATAAASVASTSSAAPSTPANVTTTGGTVNAIPLFSTATNIQNSAIAQTGTGTTARIGIGTATPAATLDVKGAATVRGALALPSVAAATKTAGSNSQPVSLVASSFSSSTSTPVNQTFQWQAESAGNDTANPSGTLNLLYGLGTTKPSETGLHIASNGQISFAPGQTFPGTGNGTVTSVATGAGLSGGPITSSGTLSIATGGVTNTMLANPSLTVSSGTGLTGGGSVALGGTTTLSLITSCVSGQLLKWNGSAWACSADANSGGTVTSVGLSAPASDFVVSGSPVTGSGTLTLAWNVAPTASNSANAIVKRDASGNFAANTISAVGLAATGAVTGNALSASTSVTGAQLITSGSVNVDVNNTNAGTELPGILFGTGNSGTAISSARTSGSTNEVGLDFYTGSTRVVSIAPSSQVAMGSPPPLDSNTQLAVSANGSTPALNAFSAVGFSSAGDTFLNGGIGGSFTGGLGDHNNGFSDGDGIDATNADGGLASGGGFAGNFTGDVNVSDQIFATVKDFKIDHPLDPANKYLFHSSVESSEMMNIYTGNVVLDGSGQATIELPDWFEALNRDFRYQLTAIGKPGPGLYVADKISGSHFSIAGGAPGAEVSWQVTAVRQDAYAKAHPLVVEQEKEAQLKGFYIHPELYGAPEEKQVEWARNPEWMRSIKELRAKRTSSQAKSGARPPGGAAHQNPNPVASAASQK